MTALFFILYCISVRVKKTKKKHDKSNTRLNINTSKILAKFYIQQQKKEVKTTSIQNWFWSFTPKSNTDLWFKTWSTAVCFLLKFNKLKFTCDKQGHNYRLQSQIWMRHYLNSIKKIIMRRGSQLWSHFFGLILLVHNYATKEITGSAICWYQEIEMFLRLLYFNIQGISFLNGRPKEIGK